MTEALEHVALDVLRKTAAYLRAHPHAWSKKDDSLMPVVHNASARVIGRALELARFETSIDTLLQAHCRILARRSHRSVLKQVYELLCDAHHLSRAQWCPVYVFDYNYCAGVDDAIAYLEKPVRRARFCLIISDAAMHAPAQQDGEVGGKDAPQRTPSLV